MHSQALRKKDQRTAPGEMFKGLEGENLDTSLLPWLLVL